MDKTPELVTSVEFDVVRKGYDPEQVDNYLKGVGDQVSRLKDMLRNAVETAEVAEAKAAEAVRLKAVAEAAREEALGDLEAARQASVPVAAPAGAGGADDQSAEELKKVLMLAQRTADSAVEEAQASARNIVADGRSKAAELVADAETRAERILVEAQKVAEETVKERTGSIEQAVTQLEVRRAELVSDVEALSRHLDEHRSRLRAGLETLMELLADSGALRADPLPTLSARAEADDAGSGGDPGPAAPAPAPSPSAGRAPDIGEPAAGPSSPAGAAPSATGSSGSGAASPSAGAAPLAGTPTTVTVTVDQPAPSKPAGGEPKASTSRVADLVEGPSAPPRAPRATVSAPAVGEAGPPTEAIPAAEREALLAEDDEDTEAMRKFFDDDLDLDEPKGRRFGRKK